MCIRFHVNLNGKVFDVCCVNTFATPPGHRWGFYIRFHPPPKKHRIFPDMIFHINKISLLIAFLQICFATLPAESSIWVQEDSSESLHKSALAAMEQKEYDRAEAYLRRLLRRNNLFRETSGRSAWYLLASALENSGEKFDAMDILSRGLDTLRAAGMFDCYLGYHLARLYAENHVDEKNPEITGLINEVLTKINPQKQINLWLEITGLIHRFLSPTELQNLQQEEKEKKRDVSYSLKL